MTEGFYDSQNRLRLTEEQTQLKHFYLTYRHFTLSALARTRRVDLSDALDRLVTLHGGDAVVNLRVHGQGTGFDANCLSCAGWLLTPVTLGLLVPSQLEATVEGDIVRLRPSDANGPVPESGGH